MLSIEELVQNGMTVLDQYDPEWFNKINLDTLELSGCHKCILGQLFYDQWYNEEHHCADPFGYGKMTLGIDVSFNLGFDIRSPSRKAVCGVCRINRSLERSNFGTSPGKCSCRD